MVVEAIQENSFLEAKEKREGKLDFAVRKEDGEYGAERTDGFVGRKWERVGDFERDRPIPAERERMSPAERRLLPEERNRPHYADKSQPRTRTGEKREKECGAKEHFRFECPAYSSEQKEN